MYPAFEIDEQPVSKFEIEGFGERFNITLNVKRRRR